MKRYEIYEGLKGFDVYEITEMSFTLVKTFKSRKGAESWVARHA